MEDQIKQSHTVITNLVKEVKEISMKYKQSRQELLKFNNIYCPRDSKDQKKFFKMALIQ